MNKSARIEPLSRGAGSGIRAVHLDMKGVPPKFSRLLRLLEIFRHAGFNAVLVEWEDAFPWTVDTAFRSQTCLSECQVRQFHTHAHELGLDIIPLVQCLGHMETPLRSGKYAYLREKTDQTDVLNVLATGASQFVTSLIEDVLALTPDCRCFFLGGDEAWSFGTHPDTQAYIRRYGKATLYRRHVEPLCDLLQARGIRPILWHDMMIDWAEPDLQSLGTKADLCIWAYYAAADIPWQLAGSTDSAPADLPLLAGGGAIVSSATFRRFLDNGIRLWGAGAYKCSRPGANSDVPDFASRSRNFQDWLEYDRTFNLQGLVATGWSRNSTDGVQYIPIDAALDTLMACGLTWSPPNCTPDRELALKALKKIGELHTYEVAAGHMMRLTKIRDNGWSVVIRLRELLAVAKVEPERCIRRLAQLHLTWLNDHCVAGDALRVEGAATFSLLIDQIWYNAYFNERLEALRAEYNDLRRQVLELPPPPGAQ